MTSHLLIYGGIAFLIILLWLVYRYGLMVPAPKGLPILLYHKVSVAGGDALTISMARLDRQLAYIDSNGYTAISFADLKESLDGKRVLPAKPIIVTFDDGYLSTYQLAYPLLVKHDVKATVFLPTASVGGVAQWAGANEALMTWDNVRELAQTRVIEFGLHSHQHESYEHYSPAQVETDLRDCLHALEESGCRFARVFAYAYGRMPKDMNANRAMRDFFREHGIHVAMRIGSRINRLPPKDTYEIKRTAIRGTDSFREFKIKLRKGRSKLF
ncbi:MAG: polysaccharide deacetylase family protein [Candidatus Acidiferrales bacterium]